MANDTRAVLCPYCGAEMICVSLGQSHKIYQYQCVQCLSLAPVGFDEQEAYADALRRPLQEPLMLEDLQSLQEGSIVWLEARNPDDVLWDDGWGMPYFHSGTREMEPRCFFYRMGIDILDIALRSDYGVTWRCWSTKPTDEERKAAKWEVKRDD